LLLKKKELLEQLFKAQARESFLDFTRYIMPAYEVNWHHALLHRTLEKFIRKEIKRLMIFTPPRHGKSQIVSKHLPAYILGHFPDAHIIAATYDSDLSKQFNRELQRIIDSEAYRCIFPDTTLYGSFVRSNSFGRYVRTTDMFEIVNHRGSYRSAGIGGSITGMGGDYIILDDLIKNAEDAYSARRRQNTWDWFLTTLYTRLEKNAGLLLTTTRWHEDDIAGRLLRSETGEDWTVVSLPALATDFLHPDDPRAVGEPLWENKYPLDVLATTKDLLGTYVFSAMYQQFPIPHTGGLFRRDFFRYFTVEDDICTMFRPDGSTKRVAIVDTVRFIAIDLAVSVKDSSDYTVAGVFGRTPDNELLVFHIERLRIEGAEHPSWVRRLYQQWKPSWIGIESVAYQLSLVQTMLREGLPVRELRPDKVREARALSAAARIEAGTVYFMDGARWMMDFENELLSFPFAAHDDQVDVLSYAAAHLSETNELFITTRRIERKSLSPLL
jgi:predicted phage terminase large subunit-like protein